jgi:formate-dependent phosphoribosylglycinamide formyltransferase (GAR transformylase)
MRGKPKPLPKVPRKALLVGSSFSAAPVFFALKKYDLHVSVCGRIESDPCHQYADASFFVDYSHPEDLAKVVKKNDFDFLVPTCNDSSYLSCAPIAEEHGFPGFDKAEVASVLHTKSKFRQVIGSLGLPSPRFVVLRKGQVIDVGSHRFPILVKPIDSFSGRGMTKVERPTDLPQAIDNAFQASCSDEIVLEEFVDGELHSHSAFIQGGQVALDFFVDEFCTVYPYQVNCSNHPSVLNKRVRESVRVTINTLVTALGLTDGLLHTQFIADGNNFVIIECMRRCPGDLYGSLIELSTGVDYADLFVRPFLSRKMTTALPKQKNQCYGRHTISVSKPLINFSFSQSIPAANVDIVSLKGSGEQLNAAPFDKFAILFAEFEDIHTMLDVTPRLHEMVQIRELGKR